MPRHHQPDSAVACRDPLRPCRERHRRGRRSAGAARSRCGHWRRRARYARHAAVEAVSRYRAQGWTITIDVGLIRRIYAMRQVNLPPETGGILFGLVDIPAKQSISSMRHRRLPERRGKPGDFVRGMGGVDEMMEEVQRRTAGQVRYVGRMALPPAAALGASECCRRHATRLACRVDGDGLDAGLDGDRGRQATRGDFRERARGAVQTQRLR